MSSNGLRKAITQNAVTSTSDSPEEIGKNTFVVEDHQQGVIIDGGNTSMTFPYSHFCFAELSSGTTEQEILIIRFSTHRVVLTGLNLVMVRDVLQNQRLKLLATIPERYEKLVTKNSIPLVRKIEFINLEVQDD